MALPGTADTTTTTQVSVDGVMQGNGGPDTSGGFERGGWARPLFDSEAMTFVDQLQVHGSGALTRWLLENDLIDEMNLLVVPVVVGQGARLFPDNGPDIALDLVESRAFPKGITIQVYRPAGRPRYATGGVDPNRMS